MTTTALALAPFTDEELFPLDVAMHVETPQDHDLMLRHASTDYVCHVDATDDVYTTWCRESIVELVAHDILVEVAPSWYGFTAQGVSRACTTIAFDDLDEQEMFADVYDGFGPMGEPDSIIRNGTDRTLYEHDPICDCERCRPGAPGDYEDAN